MDIKTKTREYRDYLSTRKSTIELDITNTTQELEHKRKELNLARNQGDLSENANYTIIRDTVSSLETKLSQLVSARTIFQGFVIPSHSEPLRTVEIGAVVEISLHDSQYGFCSIFMLVPAELAKCTEGFLSTRSLLGNALLGRMKGDTIPLDTNFGKMNYTIVDIY